jgi:beta-glucosidase
MTTSAEPLPFQDSSLPFDARVNDLVSRMTLEEKISQMVHAAAGIERLDVPPYNWWNECLHGVARAGVATVFPQAIGLAATWNTGLMCEVATAISDEARAKHHEFVRRGIRDIYTGLTFWSPNVNIFRDPRWGRGQETYGEDPYLTARMGVAFVKGLQVGDPLQGSDDPRYLKLVATPKHLAVHSGPEPDRHHFDARVNERDLRETYLPAFEACVKEAGAYSIMGAYNRTNGEACCASPTLLDNILRKEWDFEGYVVSDCWAINDIYTGHGLAQAPAQASALAVKAGCDLECGCAYGALLEAVEKHLIDEAAIDQAVGRLFTARFRLGMFDPPDQVPYAQIPYEVNDSPEHRALALRAARESIVLLKNDDDLLPLSKDIQSIAVIGPNADDVSVLLGNYNGTPSKAVTPLEGIRSKVSPSTMVVAGRGCDIAPGVPTLRVIPPDGLRPAGADEGLRGLTGAYYANPEFEGEPAFTRIDPLMWSVPTRDDAVQALEAARRADVVVMVMGLSSSLEGEEMKINVEGFAGGDRTDIALPRTQEELLKQIHAIGKPIVLVLLNGSALAINWARDNVPAIVEAWYPGEEGGAAIADVLFGDVNPGGRLPVTFYKSVDQLPPFTDYDMAGRTYRYMAEQPLYPFGYGLSYTRFEYANLHVEPHQMNADGQVSVSVEVKNIGDRAGDEVVQLYVSYPASQVTRPVKDLKGFARIALRPGETKNVAFTLAARQLAFYDQGEWMVEPGMVKIMLGASSEDIRLESLIEILR